MGIAFSIGFTFGPMIGAFFAHYAKSQGSAAYTTPLLLALCMSIVNVALVWLFLTETLPPAHRVRGYCTFTMVITIYVLQQERKFLRKVSLNQFTLVLCSFPKFLHIASALEIRENCFIANDICAIICCRQSPSYQMN